MTEENSRNEESKSNFEKIEQLSKMENLLFLDNSNQLNTTSDNPSFEKPKRLIEHANFYHNFAENNISGFDLIPLFLNKHHSQLDSDGTNVIPVIINIIQKNPDTIEITRTILTNDFFNTQPYNQERIQIRRNVQSEQSAMISYYDDKIKRQVTSISKDGLYAKSVKFKIFRNTNELLFFQNIFQYKSILETHHYYKELKKIPIKKEFSMRNLLYPEFIKNLL